MSKSQRHIFAVIALGIHKVTKKSNTHVEKSRSYIFSKSQHWNFSDPCSGLFFLFFFQNYQTLPSCVQRDSFHNEKKIKVINYLNRENLQWTDVTKWLLLYQRSKEPFSKSCQVSRVKVTQFNLHSSKHFFCENPNFVEKNSHEARCDLHNLTSKPRLIMPVQILKGPSFWQLKKHSTFVWEYLLDQLTIRVDPKLFIPNLIYFQIDQCVHKKENVDQIKT